MKLILKTIFITALCLTLPTLLFAGKKKELTKEQIEKIRQMTETIIKKTHHSLDNDRNNRRRKFKLKFHSIKNPQYFLESNFTIGRFLFGKPNYKIGVNPIVFDHHISDLALEGILAHELVHSEDYYNGSTIRTIIPIGYKVSRKKKRIQYERKTDLKTVLYGYSKGLIAYKNFQYPLLAPKELKKKKEEYLTPEEIELIDSIKEDHPELIQKWLKGKIPVDLKQFKAEIKAHLENS